MKLPGYDEFPVFSNPSAEKQKRLSFYGMYYLSILAVLCSAYLVFFVDDQKGVILSIIGLIFIVVTGVLTLCTAYDLENGKRGHKFIGNVFLVLSTAVIIGVAVAWSGIFQRRRLHVS